MKSPKCICLSAALLALAATLPAQDAEQEQFLLLARAVHSRSAPGGITNSLRVTLSDGTTTHDAHVQSVDEYAINKSLASGPKLHFVDSWKGNAAAYRLDRILGLNMVPVTVERRMNGSTAAVTWWVDHVQLRELERVGKKLSPPDSAAWGRATARMRVFDELIGNTDRNRGNILILDDWTMVLIDHTRAFDYTPDLLNPSRLTLCDRRLFDALQTLTRPQLKAELGRWLRDVQIDSLLARRDKLVAHFQRLSARKGEPAVFFSEPESR